MLRHKFLLIYIVFLTLGILYYFGYSFITKLKYVRNEYSKG